MRKILYMLGLALMLSGIYTSCKKDSLEALREAELSELDQFVKDNNLTDAKDPSGIYFKLLHEDTTGTQIEAGYKVMLNYHIITLRDSLVAFTSEDLQGNHFEDIPFFVAAKNDETNTNPLQKIEGMHIGLKKMRIGEQAFFIIPSQLAFKALTTNTGFAYLPRFSTLLVTVYAKSGYDLTPEEEE